MTQNSKDRSVIRELAEQYAEVAADPVQERREMWRRKNSLEPCRPLVHVRFRAWNAWCEDLFRDDRLACRDPFWRGHERALRMALFHSALGDDTVFEPWLTVNAVHVRHPGGVWGAAQKWDRPEDAGGAGRWEAPVTDLDDLGILKRPLHKIDEAETERRATRLREAVDGIIEVDVCRTPSLYRFSADISSDLAKLRGLEQIMIDMCDNPEGLKRLAAFMRDSVLAVQDTAEEAGDFTLTAHYNQSVPYSRELEAPKANAGPRKRRELWGFAAAQEFTVVSPAMHEEFLLAYQKPIMEQFGLSAYGCCEDLTRKIGMLRQIRNLRRIAVTPSADVVECARQIGADYVISWRPNPTDMVCGNFTEEKVRKILRWGLDVTRGLHVEICLKDIQSVEGDPGRIGRWTQVAREEAERL